MLWCLLWLSLAHSYLLAHSARILFVPAHSGASHTKSMYPAAEALARAGNDVHMLQLIDDPSQECQNGAGIVDRVIHTVGEGSESGENMMHGISKLVWNTWATNPFGMLFPWKMATDICVQILSHQSTRTAFYDIVNEHWDAVFVDDFFAVCGLAAIREQWADRGVVIVDFSTTILLPSSLESRGVVVPTSVTESFRDPIYDVTGFSYRLWVALDTFQFSLAELMLNFLIPYWGSSVGLQRVLAGLLPQKSLFAVTQVPTGLDFVQAQSRGILHLDSACSTDAPVSEPLKSFIEDQTSRGTILFAMGHYADWTYAPPGAIDAFVEAFAHLSDYRIIWQFASRSVRPNNVSSNVLMESWIPQSAILNHPKTKLFISHMGLKSMREAICARMPAVAMPMFAEQYRNTAIARYRGFAAYLDKMNLSTQVVYETIKGVLDGEQHSAAVRRLQDQLNDRIKDPLDTLVFDLEFFLRRKHERVLNRYIRPKLKQLPALTTWWRADLVLPFIALLVVGYGVVL